MQNYTFCVVYTCTSTIWGSFQYGLVFQTSLNAFVGMNIQRPKINSLTKSLFSGIFYREILPDFSKKFSFRFIYEVTVVITLHLSFIKLVWHQIWYQMFNNDFH